MRSGLSLGALRVRAIAALSAVLLAACTLTLPGQGGRQSAAAPSPITGGEITTTRLEEPKVPPVAAQAVPSAAAAKPSPAVVAPASQPTSHAGQASGGPAAPSGNLPSGTAKPDSKAVAAAPAAGQATTAAKPGATVAPGAAAAAAVPPAPPPEIKTPEQLSCERKNGVWMKVGHSDVRSCVRRMRDSGQRCSTKSDCQGQCLARSRTCSPVDPLFGCNEVMENGRVVTICID